MAAVRLSTWTLSLLSILTTLTSALSAQQRHACQSPTPNPLAGCPQGTLLVTGNSSNSSTPSTFPTIQSAILSLPHDNTTATILILPGLYREQLNITRPGPLTLLSQTSTPATLSSNTVEVIWSSATGNTVNTFDNAYTSTLTIAPTLNSSLTGSGPTGNTIPAGTPFGCSDFRAYNLNFTNDYAPYSAGPALALSTSYANTGFYQCSFKSYQDTVYVGKWANSYMKNCEVAGQTDFFYGFGTLWVESSQILLRSCGGGITAWKGSNTTYENKFGAYIHSSHVQAANSTIASTIVGKCALGRPWNAQHRSIFANTYLDASIEPSGYIEWSATDPRVNFNTTMAEYEDYGPGWNLTGRIDGNVTKILNQTMWEQYSSPAKVFQYFMSGRTGNTGWIDGSV